MSRLRLFFAAALALCAVAFGAATPALAEYNIYVTNNCHYDIRLLIRHSADGDGEHETRGWWNIAAGVRTRLADNDNEPIAHVSSELLYIYAYAPDNHGIFWNGEEVFSYEGHSYRMRRVGFSVDSNNNISFNLRCPN